MRKIGFVIGLMFATFCAYAQIGGQSSYKFLELPASARSAALGGEVVSLPNDISLVQNNLALLDSNLHNQISLGYLSFYADIRQAQLAYAYNLKKYGTWFLGVQYLNYGTMQGYDLTGAPTSEFTASDYAVSIGYSHKVGFYNLGGAVKYASSGIAGFRAHALMLDIGGLYTHPENDLTVGLAIKNIGFNLSGFSNEDSPDLPLGIQLGASFKPDFMPFRFTATAHNLQKPNISYYDPRLVSNNEEPGAVDKILRHVIIGTELIIGKNVNLRAGYNFLKRKELKLEEVGGGAGWSLGLMIKVKKFRFDYGKSFYHAVGGTNQLTFVVDLNNTFKKKL